MRDAIFEATRFRAMRKQRRLTQAQLAHLASVSLSYVKLLESGRTQPSDPYVKVLAEALGCRPADLSTPKVAA